MTKMGPKEYAAWQDKEDIAAMRDAAIKLAEAISNYHNHHQGCLRVKEGEVISPLSKLLVKFSAVLGTQRVRSRYPRANEKSRNVV